VSATWFGAGEERQVHRSGDCQPVGACTRPTCADSYRVGELHVIARFLTAMTAAMTVRFGHGGVVTGR
jgi:hypothetical protein